MMNQLCWRHRAITAIGMGADSLDKFSKKAPADEPKKEEELG